jgi:hypothetical protein
MTNGQISVTTVGKLIDFYEQGVERSIAFEPDGTKYLATCKTWSTTWQSYPSIEEILPQLACFCICRYTCLERSSEVIARSLSPCWHP